MAGRSGLHRAKTYGKKASSYSKDNAALFTGGSPSARKSSAAVKNSTAGALDLTFPSAPSGLPTRRPFTDVTNRLDRLRLDDQEAPVEAKAKGKGEDVEEPQERRVTRSGTSAQLGSKKANEKYKWLEPLITIYSKEGRNELTIQNWQDVLQDGWFVKKIAESSYAEVFKITNSHGISMLKLMALRPPTGRGSRRETAVTPDSIASEVFIMDLMADIPGYLRFKKAWVIEGQPPKQIISAFEEFEATKTSEFTHPTKYPKDQVFVALELGDAGIDVERFEIFRLSQIWDIFLNIVVALAAGEREYLFEHRDLHEGNVCVRQTEVAKDFNSSHTHRFGYSGLEVTLLDYTLSRAQDNVGFVAYRNLEEDQALFGSSLTLQSRIYQRMRAWNCFGTQILPNGKTDKNAKAPKGAWQKFKPYSNVLWIYYMFDFLLKSYKGIEPLNCLMRETETLRRNLEPGVGRQRKAFTSACDVLEFCSGEGWITSAEAHEVFYECSDEAVHENGETTYYGDTESALDETVEGLKQLHINPVNSVSLPGPAKPR